MLSCHETIVCIHSSITASCEAFLSNSIVISIILEYVTVSAHAIVSPCFIDIPRLKSLILTKYKPFFIQSFKLKMWEF